jgi:hypothetical protein
MLCVIIDESRFNFITLFADEVLGSSLRYCLRHLGAIRYN